MAGVLTLRGNTKDPHTHTQSQGKCPVNIGTPATTAPGAVRSWRQAWQAQNPEQLFSQTLQREHGPADT